MKRNGIVGIKASTRAPWCAICAITAPRMELFPRPNVESG